VFLMGTVSCAIRSLSVRVALLVLIMISSGGCPGWRFGGDCNHSIPTTAEFTCPTSPVSRLSSDPFIPDVPERGYWFVPRPLGSFDTIVAEIEVDGVRTRTTELHAQGNGLLGIRAPVGLVAGDVAQLHVDGIRRYLFDAEVSIVNAEPARITAFQSERVDLMAEDPACRASCFDPKATRPTADVLAFEYTGALFVGRGATEGVIDPHDFGDLVVDAATPTTARVDFAEHVMFFDARTLEPVAHVMAERPTGEAPPLRPEDADQPECSRETFICEG
jgi:hypothetical protein